MVVDALAQAWREWGELGERLQPSQWEAPTRLEGWTVKDVFAHHSVFPAAISTGVHATEATEPVTHTDAAALAHMQQPGGVADSTAGELRENAVALARQSPTTELVEQYRLQY